MTPPPTLCCLVQHGELGAVSQYGSAWIVPPSSRTSLKQVVSSLGTFSVGRQVTPNVTKLIVRGHTMRTFIKSFKFGNASQTMFMNKVPIENQAKLTISVIQLDLIML